MQAPVRNGLIGVGSALGGAVAAIGFMSSHSVDLYAIWDQLNTVLADVTKLVAMVSALVGPLILAWKGGTKHQLADVVADPQAPAIAAQMPVTPQTMAVGTALQTDGHS